MPEHTSFLTYLVHMLPANLDHNLAGFKTLISHEPLSRSALEPVLSSITVMLIVILFAVMTRSKIEKLDEAVVPEAGVSARNLVEILIEYAYGMMKDMMGGKRAKRYLPLIGTCACFIFTSNILSLIPGFAPPTSNLNITFGCALVVFAAYHFYGFQENGFGYIKHFLGPMPALAWLIGPIEIISNCVRPVTLGVRLMLNMSVDHIVLGIFVMLFPFLLPLPLMVLGTLVAVVQTLVFCLLSSIYISLATEHEH
ncbi:MAG: F0F1 ATP synthase subunit A [Polyangiales bacterium]